MGQILMGREGIIVRVSDNGRLSIPAKQRKQLGIENGGVVIVSVENGELHVRPVRAVLAELQDKVGQYLSGSGESVERFLADRREEAAKEGL